MNQTLYTLQMALASGLYRGIVRWGILISILLTWRAHA